MCWRSTTQNKNKKMSFDRKGASEEICIYDSTIVRSIIWELGMIAVIYKPGIQESEAENRHEFMAGINYTLYN